MSFAPVSGAEQRIAHYLGLNRPLTDEKSNDLYRALHADYMRKWRQLRAEQAERDAGRFMLSEERRRDQATLQRVQSEMYQTRREPGMNCRNCTTPLSEYALRKVARGLPITGLCLRCYNGGKKIKRECRDCGAKLANIYAKQCKPCSHARLQADTALQERRIAATKAALARPDVKARHARACRIIGDKRIAWCPVDRRDEYLRLMNRIGAAEAKAQILASMMPFERQLQRVLTGEVRVVDKVRVPGRVHSFSLTGNAASMVAHG